MKVSLKLLGCRVNEAELEDWARTLGERGHGVVPQRDADVVVINTCAVTSEAGRKSRQAIYQSRRLNPLAKLVVTGCYAELDADGTQALEAADLVLGNQDKAQLVDLLEERFPELIPSVALPQPLAQSRTRAFVKVQDGCRHRCTYCIVTVARGEERSRQPADVVAHVKSLVAAGRREVVLTGIHLGGYGDDIGSSLEALVRAVLEQTEVERLRISSLEPWNLPEGFFALWENPRLCPHLHLPLQSGSDAVLRRMARRCSTASFAALTAEARAAIPDLSVTTDVIVGFPGETEAEFAETLAFVEAQAFADLHVFSYSPRAGTAAARLKGQILGPLKRARSQALRSLGEASRRAHLERFVGRELEVLFERPEGGRALGYTRGYLRAELSTQQALQNRVRRVRCVGVRGSRLEVELAGQPLPVTGRGGSRALQRR